jgi:PhzF family phenazine biosynthesis protein
MPTQPEATRQARRSHAGEAAAPRQVPLYQVDAFTARRFAGNPAAVCLLSVPADPVWMQSVAAEMNLSETAFVVPADGAYDLRWFTPAVEVDLCGHATLAAAHVLWEAGRLAPYTLARFRTRSGELTCRQDGGWIEMDFPAEPAAVAPAPEGLAQALGLIPRWTGKNRMDWLVEAETEQAMRALRPDLAAIARIPARGVMVTARSSDPAFDFVSRFFGPAAGVPEDPVTGSAHCALAPYWGAKLGKQRLVGHQVSARGGVVRVESAGPRVRLAGQAVTVFRAELA